MNTILRTNSYLWNYYLFGINNGDINRNTLVRYVFQSSYFFFSFIQFDFIPIYRNAIRLYWKISWFVWHSGLKKKKWITFSRIFLKIAIFMNSFFFQIAIFTKISLNCLWNLVKTQVFSAENWIFAKKKFKRGTELLLSDFFKSYWFV